MKNLEIKAFIRNIKDVTSKAKELSKTDGEIIKQCDVFFNATKSRLKLRKFEDGIAQLISYSRPDMKGPKVSVYDKVSIYSDTVKLLEKILTDAVGVKGVVKKTRHVFIVGRTRIHIDRVVELGNFVELEVMMQSDNKDMNCDQKTAESTAFELMDALSIDPKDLIEEAYIDLILSGKNYEQEFSLSDSSD